LGDEFRRCAADCGSLVLGREFEELPDYVGDQVFMQRDGCFKTPKAADINTGNLHKANETTQKQDSKTHACPSKTPQTNHFKFSPITFGSPCDPNTVIR